jgi:hypothetical protein
MKNQSIEDLVHLLSGRWSGQEIITIDPSKNLTMKAVGHFENCPAFQGSGIKAGYTQEVDGTPGLACETIYRFGDDGEVAMVWFPSDGDPQILRGHRKGAVLTVTRTDADGVSHTLVSDYSRMGELTIEMTISTADGIDMKAFTGHYKRVGADEEVGK